MDILRGVAVGGILLANVLVFFGFAFRASEQSAGVPGASLDQPALIAEAIFIQGKFYSIFSLLFGIGFGLQLSRAGDAVVPRFKRRLRILLAIGGFHALFVWAGDILMLYALLGLTLPYFARKSDRQLLRWTVGLLAMHTALYVVALIVWSLVAPAPAPATAGDAAAAPPIPPAIMQRISAIGTGNIGDAFIGNLILLFGRWADLFATMRFPKVLGMFVLGLWTVRRGIVTNPGAHRRLLARWAWLGVLIGLPMNVLAAWAFSIGEYLPPSLPGLVGAFAQAIGFPMLAIGYACSVVLISLRGARLLSMFAPVGRMALTNYLMHSVICVLLSYGFGFGLWWRVSVITAYAIALAIIALQIPLSAWWLRQFQFGPVEWLWRRLTYRQPLPMRRMTR